MNFLFYLYLNTKAAIIKIKIISILFNLEIRFIISPSVYTIIFHHCTIILIPYLLQTPLKLINAYMIFFDIIIFLLVEKSVKQINLISSKSKI